MRKRAPRIAFAGFVGKNMMKAWVIDGQFGLDHLKLSIGPNPSRGLAKW